jgi:biopolymer transport protein ExbD
MVSGIVDVPTVQLLIVAATPPMVTEEAVLQVALPAVGDVHRAPNP